MTKNNGGQAFPQSGIVTPAGDVYNSIDMGGEGMTLRDYFAGQALAGIVNGMYERYGESTSPKEITKVCYAHADEMITERGKE